MWCRTVRKLVYDYADGILSPRRSERLRSHLDRCDHCRVAEEDARMVTESLGQLKDVPPPEDGLQRLETRLAFLPPLPAARPPAGRLRTLVLPYAAGLATAAVLLLVVVPLLDSGAAQSPAGPGVVEPAAGPGEVAVGVEPDEPALLPGETELHYVSEEDLQYLPDSQGNLRELTPEMRRFFLRNPRLLEQLRRRGALGGGLGNPGDIVVPVSTDSLEDR